MKRTHAGVMRVLFSRDWEILPTDNNYDRIRRALCIGDMSIFVDALEAISKDVEPGQSYQERVSAVLKMLKGFGFERGMEETYARVPQDVFFHCAEKLLFDGSAALMNSRYFHMSAQLALLRFLRAKGMEVSPQTRESMLTCFYAHEKKGVYDLMAFFGADPTEMYARLKNVFTGWINFSPWPQIFEAERFGITHVSHYRVPRPVSINIRERYALWERMARFAPPYEANMHFYDPRYFRPQAYEAAEKILRSEGYLEMSYAFQASALFGTEQRMLEYLERWGAYSGSSFHDVVQHIHIPVEENLNLKPWADAVMQHGPQMAKLVKFADKLPAPERSKDGRMFSLSATRAKVALRAYNNAAQHPAMAALCHTNNVKENDFDRALKMLEKAPTAKNLPEITIDGYRFGMEGAVFERLPANDYRGPFLGLIVDNCQYLGGAGENCAKHGVRSGNGGFYVVKKKGAIVAETWAWRGEAGEMCFDSLESLRGHVSDGQWKRIMLACAEELTKDTRHNVTALTVGTGGRTPGDFTAAFEKAAAQPKDYDGYRDSREQYLVWKKDVTPPSPI